MLNQLQTINARHMVPNKKAFILIFFSPSFKIKKQYCYV